jgi:hypothetical protein
MSDEPSYIPRNTKDPKKGSSVFVGWEDVINHTQIELQAAADGIELPEWAEIDATKSLQRHMLQSVLELATDTDPTAKLRALRACLSCIAVLDAGNT